MSTNISTHISKNRAYFFTPKIDSHFNIRSTNTAVVFWQWVNQSFNAVVNYTNRNANSPLTEVQMGTAYCSATVAACFTAIKLKSFLAKQSGPFLQVIITLEDTH